MPAAGDALPGINHQVSGGGDILPGGANALSGSEYQLPACGNRLLGDLCGHAVPGGGNSVSAE